MRKLAMCAALLWAAVSGPLAAESPVVVELFTSQGCSSCPPADRVFGEIAGRDDVIAIAMHVDYWDYLGWKDELADPSFTKRQRAYARAAGKRSVYTPQMIVAGQDHLIGTRAMELANVIDKHKRKANPVSVTLVREGENVRIVAEGNVGSGAVVSILTYTPKRTVDIHRGENAGKRLTYHNIVNRIVDLDTWDGRGEFRRAVKVPAGTPVVVLVQQNGAGPILGAARLR